ncbi:glucan endo-1,3-beta-glucosidase, acidic-like [Bidens hawaiensis]|uniref:glucan endo-1,3-beta-glucosidase, acidic-like n=1 Tax=Bidens hawaiensis TaxID=980011 RepID=UPI00404A94D6
MTSKLLLLGLLLNLLLVKDAQAVGVCYGRNGDGLPSEGDVVSLYQANGITKMRIYDPHQPTLEALKGTNIELMIGVPNDALQSLNDQNAANTWVRDNIQNYYPDVKFKYIAVGNEVDPDKESGQYIPFLLPAIRNIHSAITSANLGAQIKVSTATYTGLLKSSSPPSNGAFKDNAQGFIGPIVQFLAQNNLPMLANIYPYFSDPGSNLPYALFTATQPVVDDPNGRRYSNLFDAILDAHYAAQAPLGGENVEIVVSESGWASAEGSAVATVDNAGTYYKNLIEHVKGTAGTPLKPDRSIETYLFAMFDENKKEGAPEEKHFGLFTPDQKAKYGQLSFN